MPTNVHQSHSKPKPRAVSSNKCPATTTTYTSFPHYELRSDPAVEMWFEQTRHGIYEDFEATLIRYHAEHPIDDAQAASAAEFVKEGDEDENEGNHENDEMQATEKTLRTLALNLLNALRGGSAAHKATETDTSKEKTSGA